MRLAILLINTLTLGAFAVNLTAKDDQNTATPDET
jgi:hypothetical protein